MASNFWPGIKVGFDFITTAGAIVFIVALNSFISVGLFVNNKNIMCLNNIQKYSFKVEIIPTSLLSKNYETTRSKKLNINDYFMIVFDGTIYLVWWKTSCVFY